MDETSLNDLKQRQALTEVYASFSQSRGGLSKVLGGLVGICIILVGSLLGGGVITGILTVVATFLWLVSKEIIRARLYRPLGDVQGRWPSEKRREHIWLTGFVTLISLGIVVYVVLNGDLTELATWSYLAFVIIMPLLTWRFLRTPLEFIVGVFLLAACAVHGSGGAYSLIPSGDLSLMQAISLTAPTWSSLIGAVVLIVVGWSEHQRFAKLMQELGQ